MQSHQRWPVLVYVGSLVGGFLSEELQAQETSINAADARWTGALTAPGPVATGTAFEAETSLGLLTLVTIDGSARTIGQGAGVPQGECECA